MHQSLCLVHFLHRVKFELERLGLLGHVIPFLLDVGVEVLGPVYGFTDDHLLHVLLGDVCLGHVAFQPLELCEMCGHYY